MHIRQKHILFLLFIASISLPLTSKAQRHNKKGKDIPQKKEELSKPHGASKKDTTIIIERVDAKENRAQEKIEPLFPAKETVIIIKDPKKEAKVADKRKDTVIVFVKD